MSPFAADAQLEEGVHLSVKRVDKVCGLELAHEPVVKEFSGIVFPRLGISLQKPILPRRNTSVERANAVRSAYLRGFTACSMWGTNSGQQCLAVFRMTPA
jgi:hypothetical protein